MTHALKAALAAAVALTLAGQANAQNLSPPASGLQVLDLAGTPIGSALTYQQYTASFVATSAFSTTTFVFRHDPGFFAFDDASVADSLTPLTNLLINGSFESGAPGGTGAGAPDWTYFQQAGVGFLGGVFNAATGSAYSGVALVPNSGSQFWSDGATQGYDGIDQTFATTIGDTYDISFYLAQANNTITNYQQTSTNGDITDTGGNGIDVLVYAGEGLPPNSVPEPATLLLVGVGLAGIGMIRRRRST